MMFGGKKKPATSTPTNLKKEGQVFLLFVDKGKTEWLEQMAVLKSETLTFFDKGGKKVGEYDVKSLLIHKAIDENGRYCFAYSTTTGKPDKKTILSCPTETERSSWLRILSDLGAQDSKSTVSLSTPMLPSSASLPKPPLQSHGSLMILMEKSPVSNVLKQHETGTLRSQNQGGLSGGVALPGLSEPSPSPTSISEKKTGKRESLPDDVKINSQSVKEGYLQKKVKRGLEWRRRYFVLEKDQLMYYKHKTDQRPKATISVRGAVIKPVSETTYGMSWAFCFNPRDQQQHRAQYILVAPSEKELLDWLTHLRKQSGNDGKKVEDGGDTTSTVTSDSEKRNPASIREGYMSKIGSKRPNKTLRYFELTTTHLRYYKKKKDKTPAGEISLSGCTLRAAEKETEEKDKESYVFYITTPVDRTYTIICTKARDCEEWMSAINAQIAQLKEVKEKEAKELKPPHQQRIKESEIKPVKEGYLRKLGGNVKSIRKRYFKLCATTLEYYKNKNDGKPAGIIQLVQCTLEKAQHPQHPSEKFVFFVNPMDIDRKYILFADSNDQMMDWFESIKNQIAKQKLVKVDPNSVKEGFIRTYPVQTKSLGYLILTTNDLSYFKRKPPAIEFTKDPNVNIPLAGITVRQDLTPNKRRLFPFTVTKRHGVKLKKVQFAVDDKKDMDEWINAIRAQSEAKKDLHALYFSREVDFLFKVCYHIPQDLDSTLDGEFWAYEERSRRSTDQKELPESASTITSLATSTITSSSIDEAEPIEDEDDDDGDAELDNSKGNSSAPGSKVEDAPPSFSGSVGSSGGGAWDSSDDSSEDDEDSTSTSGHSLAIAVPSSQPTSMGQTSTSSTAAVDSPLLTMDSPSSSFAKAFGGSKGESPPSRSSLSEGDEGASPEPSSPSTSSTRAISAPQSTTTTTTTTTARLPTRRGAPGDLFNFTDADDDVPPPPPRKLPNAQSFTKTV